MVALTETADCWLVRAPVPIGAAVQSLQLPAVKVVTDMVTLLLTTVVALRLTEEVVGVSVPETTPVPDGVGLAVSVPLANGGVEDPVILAKGIIVRRLEETSKNEQT